MKILQISTKRGPNYWSNHRKNLIVMTLELQEYNEVTTDKLEGFSERLKLLMPSLHEHHCSVMKSGGFFERIDNGTLLGHVIEHIALELQTLAGMECGYGRTRETHIPGIFYVVFSYQIEQVGVRCAEIATEIADTLAKKMDYTKLAENIQELKDLYAANRLGPSTEAIIEEATVRNIPVTYLNDGLIMLGYGKKQKIFSATLTSQTSTIATDIASDKAVTKDILSAAYIPVPQGFIIQSVEELDAIIAKVGFPLTVKPRYGNHGRGVTTNILSKEQAVSAFEIASPISHSVIVESFIEGFDYRFLVINHKVVAIAKRTAAHVIGNGVNTIAELIEKTNQDPMRGSAHENQLTKIKIDQKTLSILTKQQLTLETVLPNEQVLYLKDAANLSSGGIAIDVSNEVHSRNIFLAERISRLINLDVCGIDVISKDISIPLNGQNGAVLEVNASPGFRMHLNPTLGISRNVARNFIDMLYPNKNSSRIPLVAVTGTNGKTTIVRLIAHIASQSGKHVGMSTTEGLYINQELIHIGDCSGPRSATDILRDPIVDFAILECARGGIIRSGLGFDHCSTSVLSNISEDHLGMDDIHTLEELTKVKSVVPHSTLPDGYAILNADDERVLSIKDDLKCNIALFSMTKSESLTKHCEAGGLGCFVQEDHIYLWEHKETHKIMCVKEIPITLNGKSKCMISNVLAAILVSVTNDFNMETIVNGIKSFYPTPKHLPGRYNLYHINQCQVMLDYAHNEKAYQQMLEYVEDHKALKKIGIIAGTGNRIESDIQKTGYYAAKAFDEIIIRHDIDPRGRSNEEITNLLMQGIHNAKNDSKNEIDIKVISDEFEAISMAIQNAEPNTFIWYFPDNVLKSTYFLNKLTHSFSLENKIAS